MFRGVLISHLDEFQDSSKPLDDPLDNEQDGFPGTSPHGGSGGSDTRGRPLRPGRGLKNLLVATHGLSSGNPAHFVLPFRSLTYRS